MSSPTITPDAATMPLADLKQAAGLNAPAAPEITPAAPPAQPEWGQMSKADDGTYQVTLSTGEVFKGSAEEVIAKQAEAHVSTKRWGQEWKQKAEVAQPPAAPPDPSAGPQLSPEEIGVLDWQDGMEAKRMGITVEELRQERALARETVIRFDREVQTAEFYKICPKFDPTPENGKVMEEYVLGMFPRYNNGGFPRATELKQAFAMAVLDGKLAPREIQQSTTTATRPLPMPGSGSATSGTSADAWNMPMADLKKAAGLG